MASDKQVKTIRITGERPINAYRKLKAYAALKGKQNIGEGLADIMEDVNLQADLNAYGKDQN